MIFGKVVYTDSLNSSFLFSYDTGIVGGVL